ncbi:hypothetical protein [uncultured Photobacterium sp.]|uniref:hypothetical protein n=1 Tax=uncultured Photobacterium sp. TaxID=173973 RepID=UPI00260B8E7E|nr:hypothetical protein [uncultured Photobacterium sp.]
MKKKKLERFQFDKFIQVTKLQITDLIETESPDFIFNYSDKRIGVEVTEIKHPSKKEIAGIQRSIVQRAKQLSSDLPVIEVKISFVKPVNYRKGKKEEIALHLIELVTDSIQEAKDENGSKYKVPLQHNSRELGIGAVYINYGICNGVSWLSQSRWSCIECGFVSLSFESLLSDYFELKNVKVSSYLSNCEECWLLIVSDCSKKDQMFRLGKDENTVFKTEFSRVFFLELSSLKLNELVRE